ncbi:MAG: D-aminoacyl-tRNA deacylase [Spirochaetes bacterium]|jgi:D-tyrosyl-tRNA(Tyr) deacylase|nr:D-aminoacyl-tRNA deacylase [Spirochaetota bacterium]
MRAIVQRVDKASVEVDGKPVSAIGAGILALAGFHRDDTADDSEYIISKILNLRIFEDDKNAMNLSISGIEGEILIVSQFTLYGDARKGRRPSYSDAMPPDAAQVFYQKFLELFKSRYERIQSGIFGADMKVSLVNSGPVTIMLDSGRLF